ncbi:uncharacterized protein At4g14450, chloroplastic-like [Andrographis paniculata]|uniref:uncharacterized protein At4g14450, chloroplastic-like n=1 Tax=Andrographis paniculata TaxID=175694 RepID=UPI0021E729FD|nr:uncharacterized protein At4g14450, chloroplastic-like [Andrographis paniculata]
MADAHRKTSASRRQPSRLQRRAPASIQISPATEWNVAIPLLSPLVQSPTAANPTPEMKLCSGAGSSKEAPAPAPENPAVVAKKWQHPAAPFYYEATPFRPFVCTGRGSLDR